ncbi:hypothetical protein J2X68_002374 [Streptomyces sp. 3330]|uniref:hypothetical protein n=1 Tax=Streptomyces sp. 3330 TaxID=2817755 RepID=UPI002866B90A|nr:hypothetical protein [Streptomyces sp. 3330]MDR6975690.1 hypothetical protein [Streptomyces sp. 3330]
MPATAGAPGADRAGGGSGLLMPLRQVGAALGIALPGSLLASALPGSWRLRRRGRWPTMSP